METFNATSLTPKPISVLSERRTEHRKSTSLQPSTSPLKFSCSASLTTSGIQECLSRTFQGGVALLSSLLGTGVAKALTYEEALEQTVGSSPIDEFDASGILTSVTSFAADNPTAVAGGVTVLAVPLILSLLLNKPNKPWGVESAKKAYAVLGEDKNAQLLDIRAPVELKKVGSPDVKSLGKKPVAIVYKGEDKPGFLKKLALKFKEPENTTLFILDKFDGNSELVAELVTANGFKAAYAIKDGAEGPRGWLSSGLPWIEPRKALSLDFSSLSDSISDAFGEGSNAVPATLAVAAAAGFGLLAFSEIETILQVLGSAAIIQFASKKLLYAEASL
ncbi:Rhodanese-like domain-containing protein 4, chloroplastic [Turnera subulata]|uniref:Rhodanese-like domain-containing protein 4, chloroplastic n=1 Tax=Turnera subulata TaxID=218843 RepID=A0A9Q0FT08_9ROSI|nr:Rhodanese-like domain-containing protein 4, chloroplastic [Turnera subulata]